MGNTLSQHDKEKAREALAQASLQDALDDFADEINGFISRASAAHLSKLGVHRKPPRKRKRSTATSSRSHERHFRSKLTEAKVLDPHLSERACHLSESVSSILSAAEEFEDKPSGWQEQFWLDGRAAVTSASTPPSNIEQSIHALWFTYRQERDCSEICILRECFLLLILREIRSCLLSPEATSLLSSENVLLLFPDTPPNSRPRNGKTNGSLVLDVLVNSIWGPDSSDDDRRLLKYALRKGKLIKKAHDSMGPGIFILLGKLATSPALFARPCDLDMDLLLSYLKKEFPELVKEIESLRGLGNQIISEGAEKIGVNDLRQTSNLQQVTREPDSERTSPPRDVRSIAAPNILQAPTDPSMTPPLNLGQQLSPDGQLSNMAQACFPPSNASNASASLPSGHWQRLEPEQLLNMAQACSPPSNPPSWQDFGQHASHMGYCQQSSADGTYTAI